MGIVHVPHFKARSFSGETTRPQRREPPLVRHLRQRVRLVHELAELRRAKESLDDGRYRTGIHEVVDVDFVRIGVDRHPLLDEPSHPRQAYRELVRDEFAHRPHSTVAEMVDVVDLSSTLAQVDQVAEDLYEILLVEDRFVTGGADAQAPVDLIAAHTPEVVTLRVEENVLQRRPSRLYVGRVTGP